MCELEGVLLLFGFTSLLPFSHLFPPCQTWLTGGVSSTWAHISALPPISCHPSAWVQSTLHAHPAETQPPLKETEEERRWWRFTEEEGETGGDRNRDRREKQRCFGLILNSPKYPLCLLSSSPKKPTSWLLLSQTLTPSVVFYPQFHWNTHASLQKGWFQRFSWPWKVQKCYFWILKSCKIIPLRTLISRFSNKSTCTFIYFSNLSHCGRAA